MKMLHNIITTLILLFYINYTSTLSCLDDNGKSVEWFVAYKLPKSFKLMYITPQTKDWTLSDYLVSKGGMLKNTFDAMYSLASPDIGVYGMYNDEKPGIVSNSDPIDPPPNAWWGHMKGAFAFDKTDIGFWIIHSIPKLSMLSDKYSYPPTGKRYGQHVLCVNLKKESLNAMVEQFAITRPLFQGTYISDDLAEQYPKLVSLLNNKKVKHADKGEAEFESAEGDLPMHYFSKSFGFHADLYHELVAPSLRCPLDVETWRHGGSEASECDRYAVKNILKVKLPSPAEEFEYNQDHAKWAVSTPHKQCWGPECNNTSNNWVCLGDINRQVSQFKRGGGTMCIRHDELWKAFFAIVAEVQECDKVV